MHEVRFQRPRERIHSAETAIFGQDMATHFTPEALKFLRGLARNNDRTGSIRARRSTSAR
jgi:hypothetical protein